MTDSPAPASDAAWDFFHTVLSDLAEVVRTDARDERERVEGYRVLARTLALVSELSVDVDPEVPRMFPMTTPLRQIAGPNPDGEYDLCALSPGRAYRITGTRGTVTYLGFQVMAGVGLTPRRQAGYLSDRDLALDAEGRFALVLAAEDPGTGEQWVPIPEDASAVVVRQYVADRSAEALAKYAVSRVDDPGPVAPLDDATCAEQLTALAWTAVKLMTLHRTILPDLHRAPNVLVTAEASAIGSENTTPDNLYMLGMFELEPEQALEIDLTPPRSRYWSVTLENVWHECLEPLRTRSSTTQVGAIPNDDGTVRLLVAGRDPGPGHGTTNWLDTGGRRRGFVVVRWLDNPEAPQVTTRVVQLADTSG